MHIWELLFDGTNQYAVLVAKEDAGNFRTTFTTLGEPKHWPTPPRIMPFIEKAKKHAKPRADISYLLPGAIVLNQRAYQCLNDFLLPFGQLLPVDCEGDTEYFYNVTNMLACIDVEKSEKRHTAVVKEVFFADVVPQTPAIFKDPHTARTRIYMNQPAKQQFEHLCNEAGLCGVRIVPAGQGLM